MNQNIPLKLICFYFAQVCERVFGVNVSEAVNSEMYEPDKLANQIIAGSKPVHRIGFVGLGAMGFGMATHLLASNYSVIGFDVSPVL